MALASAYRASEIRKLNINFMEVTQDKVIFTLADFYTKSKKQNDKPLEMILSKQTLDVRGCIMAYLERTTTFR